MRGYSRARRSNAMLAIIIFLIFLFCGDVHLSSGTLKWKGFCENESVVEAVRQGLKRPDYLSVGDYGDEDNGSVSLIVKKKTHIQIKKLIFMNIFFSMVIFPILTFMISIRLFGRCLARLWHVIMYIHKSDGGEIPLVCFES